MVFLSELQVYLKTFCLAEFVVQNIEAALLAYFPRLKLCTYASVIDITAAALWFNFRLT